MTATTEILNKMVETEELVFDIVQMAKDWIEGELTDGEIVDKYLDPTGATDVQKAIVITLMRFADEKPFGEKIDSDKSI